jgi:pyruvate-ferredoxin/flavodoxin oxidoreductase
MSKKCIDGNEAAALVAYDLSEVIAIYPITPSSPMGEWADQWAVDGKKNLWDTVPRVVEMQSEAGASGALHGAAQEGALVSTFTASQGLLLMIPDMYKMAGELTPAVMHVAARSLAVQALSIFGDFSDVMAARSTGWAMLASGSVQEAHDMALIAHAATLEARIPFIHFFEGFRVSHEINKIELLSREQIRGMIHDDFVIALRNHALSPDHPFIRGTAQNPDVYFQARETVNPFYEKTPTIVEKAMQKFAELTGRTYHLMDYFGAEDAEKVIVMMGAGAQTAREAVAYLQQKGEKVGLVQVRLFRPFSIEHLLKVLPKTIRAIAVLDRTKEPGALGEPLYQDVKIALEALKAIKVVGGRYGLSSKEFTPAMVTGIFTELSKEAPKDHFTIGIHDDVTHTSLDYDENFILESDQAVRALFFGLGSDGTVGANKNSIKIIGEETDFYAQGYFVYDSKKSGSRTVSHLRFGPEPIRAPYLIQSANFIGVHQFNFIDKIDVLREAAEGAVFLLNSPYGSEEIWNHLPRVIQEVVLKKHLSFYVIDAYKVARETSMGSHINTIMQVCFFAISGVLPREEAILKIKEYIKKTYAKKGEEVVQKNFAAVDQTLVNLHEVSVPEQISENAYELPPIVSEKAPEFVQKVTAKMIAGLGDTLPVSVLPNDGTYPSATTQWEKRNVSIEVADWDPELCIQCGRCSMVCPHGVIRVKHYDTNLLDQAPAGFKSAVLKGKDQERFTLQVYLEDCTGCDLCHQICPVKSKAQKGKKAINLVDKTPILETERQNIAFFETLPDEDRQTNTMGTVKDIQYLQPLFEFSSACAGCGETPYIKLVSQLFGDRMLVANATGCTSIYGGNLPTTPWSINAQGRGPAWSNSLFEDNAEFGFGFCLTHEQHKKQAAELLQALELEVGKELTQAILNAMNDAQEESVKAQRQRLVILREKLEKLTDPRAEHLLSLLDHFVKRSIWLMGGDGWAYDIGYGGLDHVLASGRDVNALVLDTEVYSNTGGQASKATPLGAVAKFAAAGKALPKKDLALMMMSYGYVYVAQVAIGADMMHTLKAIREAESYRGPSIIIAYSQCIAHSIDMRLGMEQQRLAVESGYWPLFRYHPDRIKEGKNPLMLDSKPPSIPLKDYVYNEGRFKSLLDTNPAAAEELLKLAQAEVDYRFRLYEKMAK